MHPTARTWVTIAAIAVALPALASCQAGSEGGADAATAPPSTVAITPSPTAAAPRPTVESPPTDPPVATDAVSTTGEPSTTAAPSSTTTVPPTTAAPTTTLPRNYVAVPALAEPLGAVGTSSGDETARLQLRLLELGFWVQGVDGQYGLTTRQAVMAFQKYVGLNATGSVDGYTAAFLSAATERARARADSGTIVEVDKGRQVLFIVQNGATLWVLNTSTGSEIPYEEVNQKDPTKVERGDSITDNGLFRVNRERAEGWWEGDLGEIYRPKYFNGGIAVHGSNSVPNYPASHGCVRVSVPAMDFIWELDLMPKGTPVWVHEGA